MSKKVYITIIVLSLLLCGSIVFLGLSIRYGLTHQATKKHSAWDDIFDDNEYNSDFIIQKID